MRQEFCKIRINNRQTEHAANQLSATHGLQAEFRNQSYLAIKRHEVRDQLSGISGNPYPFKSREIIVAATMLGTYRCVSTGNAFFSTSSQ